MTTSGVIIFFIGVFLWCLVLLGIYSSLPRSIAECVAAATTLLTLIFITMIRSQIDNDR